MQNLIVKTLNREEVLKNFDSSLLAVWKKSSPNYPELASMLKHRSLVPIPKAQSASYIILIELIDTPEDGQYLIDLFNYNIYNEESLGLLLTAVYLIYREGSYSIGIEVFTDYIFNNPSCPTEFYLIAEKYFL